MPSIFTVLNDHPAIAIRAARAIADAIKKKAEQNKPFVLGLATGSTMEPVYAELIRLHQAGELSFSHVKCFNLDNYVGLPRDDRNSFEAQLHQLFLKHVNVLPENIHLVSSDTDFNHSAYEALITASGGIDIQLVGLGGEGHIAFNEKGSDENTPTREVRLSSKTKEDNGKYFNQIDKTELRIKPIPDTAHTRGIGPILQAKKIIFLANGHAKAHAVHAMCAPTPVQALPARALHMHPNLLALVDQDAISLFNAHELQEHTDLDLNQSRKTLEKNQSHWVNLDIRGNTHRILLPPQFVFFNPQTMHLDESFDYTNPNHLNDLAAHLAKAKHLVVGAHPDDAEIMAGPIMLESPKDWLTLIVTNGAATNNTLNGEYSQYTPEQLTNERQMEQRRAAKLANIPVIMCKFPTPAITGDMGEETLAKARTTLAGLFGSMINLEKVFGHNPLDSHDTHVTVFAEQVRALRTLCAERLNLIDILGMEVWGLLFVADTRLKKIAINTETLLTGAQELIGLYQSQIEAQGRDYSKTTVARAYGNAGYQTHPHGENPAPGLLLAVHLTDLVQNKAVSVIEMVQTLFSELEAQMMNRTNTLFRPKHPSSPPSTDSAVTLLNQLGLHPEPDPKTRQPTSDSAPVIPPFLTALKSRGLSS
ncbi:MAG: 6-phosphogluconolactonase [Legionellaceae bacterium]|nr:6-phosphogluconolactonase [Legionellaceae bacterium]